jgi:hypothetical protein
VVLPQVRLADELLESCVTDYEPVRRGDAVAWDPRVEQVASGITCGIEQPGFLEIAWRTTNPWRTFRSSPAEGAPELEVQVPESFAVSRRATLSTTGSAGERQEIPCFEDGAAKSRSSVIVE